MLLQILASPGGLSALQRMFDEGGINTEKVLLTLAALQKPTPLPGDADAK